VFERETSLSFIKLTQSLIKIICYVCMKLSVEGKTTQVGGNSINVDCQ
jgi:hypothetical protein